jgi:hypothetical protein
VALALGVLVILVLRFVVYRDEVAPVEARIDSIPAAEQRLSRLRQISASVPGKETLLKQVDQELASREKGILAADTAAQAQAQLLEILRGVAKAQGIEVRGAEELRIRPLAEEYGEAAVTVSFNCRIEQLVNLLAALTSESPLISTNEVRITATNAKDKAIQVRLSLAGVVPRKLVPAKRGLASF